MGFIQNSDFKMAFPSWNNVFGIHTYTMENWKGKKIHIRNLLGFCQRTKVLAYLRNEKPKGKKYSYLKLKKKWLVFTEENCCGNT